MLSIFGVSLKYSVVLKISVQNNSPTKLSSNVVLEQRLRCYQLKYLYILLLYIYSNKIFTNIFKC
jgi:hypothetical protein